MRGPKLTRSVSEGERSKTLLISFQASGAASVPRFGDKNTGGLTPNATHFVAARRKPSGIGVDNTAKNRAACAAPLPKDAPNGSNASAIGRQPLGF